MKRASSLSNITQGWSEQVWALNAVKVYLILNCKLLDKDTVLVGLKYKTKRQQQLKKSTLVFGEIILVAELRTEWNRENEGRKRSSP